MYPNTSMRPNYNKPVTLYRHLLSDGKGDEQPFGRLSFLLLDNRLLVNVVGLHRPGLLAYLTKKFLDFKADIEWCSGERLRRGAGALFEITGPSKEDFGHLCDEFLNHDLPLLGPLDFVPTRFFDLLVKVPRNQSGLLHTVAKVLADHNVDLAYFMADKVGGKHQVMILARLELAAGVNELDLRVKLEKSCPEGSVVDLQERPHGLYLPKGNGLGAVS
jgi:glycine cleavage system regulatory protein